MKQQAKYDIILSFKTLLSKHSIDKITIKEVCQLAGVNRQTFYYYFEDIFGIFKTIVTNELSKEIADNKTLDTWQGGFLTTMNYLRLHSDMILHVYHSSFRQDLTTFANSFSNELLKGVILECERKLQVKLIQQDLNFLISLYRYLFNGLMFDWVQNGMKEEPDLLLKKLEIIIKGSISRAVEDFSKEVYKD